MRAISGAAAAQFFERMCSAAAFSGWPPSSYSRAASADCLSPSRIAAQSRQHCGSSPSIAICTPRETSPRRSVIRATPARHAFACAASRVARPLLNIARAGSYSSRNSSCIANSREIDGTWSGARVCASLSATSQSRRSRRISRAEIGCDDARKSSCARSWYPQTRATWPARRAASSTPSNFCIAITIPASPSSRYTRVASGTSSWWRAKWPSCARRSRCSSFSAISHARFPRSTARHCVNAAASVSFEPAPRAATAAIAA